MLQHLWNGLFPTLPYEGRINVRWRDVGFQVRWASTADLLACHCLLLMVEKLVLMHAALFALATE